MVRAGGRREALHQCTRSSYIHMYVRYDAVEAHSCVHTDSVSPCKQLTKTLGLKCPAIEYLTTVVYCSSSESLLYLRMYICGPILLCLSIRMYCSSKENKAKTWAKINGLEATEQ